jgi:hypothetical protein
MNISVKSYNMFHVEHTTPPHSLLRFYLKSNCFLSKSRQKVTDMLCFEHKFVLH